MARRTINVGGIVTDFTGDACIDKGALFDVDAVTSDELWVTSNQEDSFGATDLSACSVITVPSQDVFGAAKTQFCCLSV